MRLTVLGCSDAFGSGGRLQTAFHVSHPTGQFLIDCGATTLIGMQRERLDPNRVSTIFITHLHGDHFAGLIWWLIHAKHVSKRTAPLTVTGPVGIEARFKAAAETLYPGSMQVKPGFELIFIEYSHANPVTVEGGTVTPYTVSHPSGAPSYAVRVDAGRKTISFSGDTEWTPNLVEAAAQADLFIADCFGYDDPAGYHMSWQIIEHHLPVLTAKRILLSHMGLEMLSKAHTIKHPRVLVADDGLKIDV